MRSKTWQRTSRKAGIPYFRLNDLRSTHATRLSADGVADKWVIELLRQTDAKVFKKLFSDEAANERDALAKLHANEQEFA